MWIVGLVEIFSDLVVVSIPPEKLSEFRETVTDMLKSNLVAVRKLGKLAGKASHFASMIYVWRRFLAELWGALQESENPQAQGMHQKDAYGLDKLNLHSCGPQPSCLGDQGHGECVQKLWCQSAYCGRCLGFWLGAYLTVNGKVVSGYASDTSREDEKILDIRRGDEKCQQVVESLNLLVALRTWKKFWAKNACPWKSDQTTLPP